VIGAGVFGCAIARELAERGRHVMVVERAAVGAGASAGPGWRGVRMNARDARETSLAPLAHALWRKLGYTRTGHLHVVAVARPR
jgi:glycine/D-amino acid oxidase-like deaminating enzyme